MEVAAVHGWLLVRIAITIGGALTYRFEPECVIASRSWSKGGVRASKEDDPREGRGLVHKGQRTVFLARRHYATDFDLVTSEKPYTVKSPHGANRLLTGIARRGLESCTAIRSAVIADARTPHNAPLTAVTNDKA